MKKYILILTAVVLAVMSCSTDNIENGPSSLDIEIVPAWDITRGITSASQTVKLTVNLNVQTIHWQVSSDSEWCKVDSDLSIRAATKSNSWWNPMTRSTSAMPC